MILPLSIAEKIIHYICDKFYEYDGGDKEEFLENAANYLNYGFYVSWSGAGSYGNCWDEKIVKFEASPEPSLIDLNNFLTTYFPDINQKDIDALIEYETTYERDYYGGGTTRHEKGIKFSALIEYLESISNQSDYVCLDKMLNVYGDYVQHCDSFSAVTNKLKNQPIKA